MIIQTESTRMCLNLDTLAIPDSLCHFTGYIVKANEDLLLLSDGNFIINRSKMFLRN